MKKILAYAKYVARHRKTSVMFVIVLATLLFCDWFTGWQSLDSWKTAWDGEVSQLVTFATLFVAIAVWWAELIQEWRDQLPKRLTVDFIYYDNEEPRKVMRCEKAHLSDTADIRALGQQIGLQIADPIPPKLDFRAPYVTQDEGKTEYSQSIGHFRHYKVTFTLTTLPEKLKIDEYKLWVEPFDKSNITKCAHQ